MKKVLCELHDVLLAFAVDDVVTETAGCDERRVACDVAGAKCRSSFEVVAKDV